MLGIFLDTETNGLNPKKHKVIEIAFQIIDILTGECKAAFESTVNVSEEEWKMSDPASLKVNGFSWKMVCDAEAAESVGRTIVEIFRDQKIQRGSAVFICQNPSFDRAFFAQLVDPDLQEKMLWPYHWLDLASMHWAKAMGNRQGPLPWETGYSKDKIAVAYKLPREEQPHRAMNGVKHLVLCYRAVVGFLEEPSP